MGRTVAGATLGPEVRAVLGRELVGLGEGPLIGLVEGSLAVDDGDAVGLAVGRRL